MADEDEILRFAQDDTMHFSSRNYGLKGDEDEILRGGDPEPCPERSEGAANGLRMTLGGNLD
jgi:hypothetical protein